MQIHRIIVSSAPRSPMERRTVRPIAQAPQSVNTAKQEGPTWAMLREELQAIYTGPERAKATWAKHRQAFGFLAASTACPSTIGVVAIASAVKAINDGKRRPNTVNSLLRAIRRQVNYCEQRGWIQQNPFRLHQFSVRKQPALSVVHSAGDLAKVMARADEEAKAGDSGYHGAKSRWKARRLRALLYLLAHTGLRSGEALNLHRADIASGVVWIRAKPDWRPKTALSEQPVPLAPNAAAAVGEWLKMLEESRPGGVWLFPQLRADRPWVGGASQYRPTTQMVRLGERAGVSGLTLLSLRHSWSTHAESLWGFSPAVIQRVLRHGSEKTQEHYRRAELANLGVLISRCSFTEGQ